MQTNSDNFTESLNIVRDLVTISTNSARFVHPLVSAQCDQCTYKFTGIALIIEHWGDTGRLHPITVTFKFRVDLLMPFGPIGDRENEEKFKDLIKKLTKLSRQVDSDKAWTVLEIRSFSFR